MSLLDCDRTLPPPRPVMRPPRLVITRKADLTLLTERSDLARLPFCFNQSAACTLANLAGFLSAASSPHRPRPCPSTPPQPRSQPCRAVHARVRTLHRSRARCASAPASSLPAAQRRRSTIAEPQTCATAPRATVPEPHRLVPTLSDRARHCTEVRARYREDLTLATLILAVLFVSFCLRDRLHLHKVTSLPWIRVCC
jgi:hypothetical protein